MWRIGRLAAMTGVSERTLRHYDAIGLLPPAAVSPGTGYRWYGVVELTRLERIRGLQRLGLPLRRIADLLGTPDPVAPPPALLEHGLRAALAENADRLRQEIAALTAALAAAEERLAAPSPLLPYRAAVGARHLRVRRARVGHPGELADLCAGPAGWTLLTWLAGPPTDGFPVAVTATGRGTERLPLPGREVVRAVLPAGATVAGAGRELFAWVRARRLAPAGPTVEDHLVDGDGRTATVLEIPVAAA